MRMYLPTHVDLPPLVQNWFRRITAYTTLLGDTCADIHGFPSLDDMLEKQEIIERWIEEPPTIDRTLSRRIAFSSLDDAKKGIARDTLRRQEEIRTSALYLREHGLPWTWEGGKVRPVVTEGEMITASYHLEYPTLSLLRKRRIPGSLKKLPETQFPYRSLHHVEVERYVLTGYEENPRAVHMMIMSKRHDITFCSLEYATHQPGKYVVICM